MGEILSSCEKCGKEEWHIDDEYYTIQGKLCDRCYSKWMKFFAENQKELESQYPDEQNPTWLAFVGQLPKEKVMFT